MAITIDWPSKVISIPQADLTFISGTLYEGNTETIRLALHALSASEEGMPFQRIFDHNTEVTVAGTTFARTIEIINGYSITFTPDAQWSVRLVGSNNNYFDIESNILNQNQVQVIPSNSAGLVVAVGAVEVLDRVEEMLGLGGSNTVWSSLSHDGQNNLIAARITQYTDSTLAVIDRAWDMTASYDVFERLASYQLVDA